MPYRAVGLMSGSSLDGLDVCCVDFAGDFATDSWTFSFVTGTTYKYSPTWRERLQLADSLCGSDTIQLHIEYGHLIGQTVRQFIDENNLEGIHLIASHGHTVFHQPDKRMTFQIGDGETIASYVKCPVVNNFRSKDIALGGQGAPLVPLGEQHLFGQYDICLNLGGIANVSFSNRGQGFDICPSNMLLNYLAERYNVLMEYDKDGLVAKSGSVNCRVLEQLAALPYYGKKPPKSLGREWFDAEMKPLLDIKNVPIPDLLRTAVEHICTEIPAAITRVLKSIATPAGMSPGSPTGSELKLLVTGGGAHNIFLVEQLKKTFAANPYTEGITFETCDKETIDFKEAIIFAFMGLRCLLGLTNIDNKVTGASKEVVAGSIQYGAGMVHNDSTGNLLRCNLRKTSGNKDLRESSTRLSGANSPSVNFYDKPFG